MRTFEFSSDGYNEMRNYREYLFGIIKINDVAASKRRLKVSCLLVLLMISMFTSFGASSTVAFQKAWIFEAAMKWVSKASCL